MEGWELLKYVQHIFQELTGWAGCKSHLERTVCGLCPHRLSYQLWVSHNFGPGVPIGLCPYPEDRICHRFTEIVLLEVTDNIQLPHHIDACRPFGSRGL